MDLNLAGRTVLITGASKGIGAAAAEVFAEEGCHLILAARSGQVLETLCQRLRSAHQIQARAVPTDIRDPAQLAALAEAARDADILVNNAGDIPGGTLDAVDEERWRHAWELKVFGYINLTRAIYAHMKARGSGVIINDIGAAGERMDAGYIAGSTGNAALYAFTRALGGKSLKDGIRVVGVSPGPVETDRIVTLMKTAAERRFGDAERYRELMANSARPPRPSARDRRHDGLPGLRPKRLHHRRRGHHRWRPFRQPCVIVVPRPQVGREMVARATNGATGPPNVISAAASKERPVFNRPINKPLASAYDRQVEGLQTCAWEVGSA